MGLTRSDDTYVQCDWCGREERTGFAASLGGGWPTCCKGHTMRLIRSEADIDAAVRHVTGSATRAITASRGAEDR